MGQTDAIGGASAHAGVYIRAYTCSPARAGWKHSLLAGRLGHRALRGAAVAVGRPLETFERAARAMRG